MRDEEKLTRSLDDDCDDEAVDTKHTRHDYGNDVSHDNARVHHTHRRNSHTRLGRAVCCANI